MKHVLGMLAGVILLSLPGQAAPKPHIVTLGKATSISVKGQDSRDDPIVLRVRPLLVDGRNKEFTVGAAHDVTDRTFVVQRIYRVNDSLPQEAPQQRWNWQRGGWLLVNRVTGKIQPVALPDFDPDSSAVSWYRDYAAYCGDSEDGGKTVAVIVQLGQRKALLKKSIGDASNSQQLCPPPSWDRNPIRSTFELKAGQKLTFAVKNRAAEAVEEDSDDESD